MRQVRSLPERFALTVVPGEVRASHLCSFAIPAGKWESGTWTVIGEIPSGTPFVQKSIGADLLPYRPAEHHRERYELSGPVGPATLESINRAPGGGLITMMADVFGECQPEGAVDIVVACILTLVGTEHEKVQPSDRYTFTAVYDATCLPPLPIRMGTPDPNIGRITTYIYDTTDKGHRR